MGGERTPDAGALGEQHQRNGRGQIWAKFCEASQGAAPTGLLWGIMKMATPPLTLALQFTLQFSLGFKANADLRGDSSGPVILKPFVLESIFQTVGPETPRRRTREAT